MGITFTDYLIDSGYYDITPEQERDIEIREEHERARERADIIEKLANWIDPEIGFPDDNLLRHIHADIEIRGRKNPDFAVTVHHRNIVLSAVANALRNSHLLTWDEWCEHCGWPKEEEKD